jgi:hypothetical protein
MAIAGFGAIAAVVRASRRYGAVPGVRLGARCFGRGSFLFASAAALRRHAAASTDLHILEHSRQSPPPRHSGHDPVLRIGARPAGDHALACVQPLLAARRHDDHSAGLRGNFRLARFADDDAVCAILGSFRCHAGRQDFELRRPSIIYLIGDYAPCELHLAVRDAHLGASLHPQHAAWNRNIGCLSGNPEAENKKKSASSHGRLLIQISGFLVFITIGSLEL